MMKAAYGGFQVQLEWDYIWDHLVAEIKVALDFASTNKKLGFQSNAICVSALVAASEDGSSKLTRKPELPFNEVTCAIVYAAVCWGVQSPARLRQHRKRKGPTKGAEAWHD